MAQIGQGYDQFIGTRASATNPQTQEFFNKKTNQGFENPDQLAGFASSVNPNQTFNAQNVFSQLQTGFTPTVPVNVNPSTSLTSDTFAQPTKTALDVQSLVAQNQKMQQTLLQSMTTPDPQMQQIQGQLNQVQNQAMNTKLAAQSGISMQRARPVAMQSIIGNSQNIQEAANNQIQTLASQAQPLVQNLEILSQNRNQLLKAQEMAIGFGKEDINLAMQIEQNSKQEAQAAKQLALEYGVTQPFYEVGGTVYRTSDGKAYSTPEQFMADGGNWGAVQKIDPAKKQQEQIVQELLMQYPDAGISLSDTIESAQAKLSRSRIYQEAVRPPSSGGGGDGPLGGSELDTWVSLLASGQVGVSQIPMAIRNDVIQTLGDSGETLMSPKAREAQAAYSTAEAQLDTIEQLASKVVTSKSPIAANVQGFAKWLGAVTKSNPDAALYRNTVDAFTASLSRAAGENGVLTDQDVSRIKNALPALNDTADIAKAKLNTLRNLFAARRSGSVNAYTSSFTGPTTSSASNDPLGIR